MTHAVLLGRDSWAEFPTRKYVDISEKETLVTFTVSESETAENARRYSDWVNSAVGLVETSTKEAVVARFSGKRCRLPSAMAWVKIDITNTDGTAASEGTYYTRFNKGWLPREAIVEAGTSEIPLRHTGNQLCSMTPNMKLGVGGAPLVKSDLTKAQILPTQSGEINTVEEAEAEKPRKILQEVLDSLDEDQRAAFVKLWQRVPPHLHEINFDFEKELWKVADIDALAELLCSYQHRFSHHSTDLGHVTVDPFRII